MSIILHDDKIIAISSDNKDYSNVDFGENVGDKKNEGYDIYNKNIIGKIRPNGSKYTEEQIQETIDYRFGKGSYNIDWKKYKTDKEYQEQVNYYYFQAEHFVKVKTIDKVTDDYVEIT